jgi:hypothetical protein
VSRSPLRLEMHEAKLTWRTMESPQLVAAAACHGRGPCEQSSTPATPPTGLLKSGAGGRAGWMPRGGARRAYAILAVVSTGINYGENRQYFRFWDGRGGGGFQVQRLGRRNSVSLSGDRPRQRSRLGQLPLERRCR